MKSLVIAAFLAVGVAMPASAQVQYVYCEMTDLGNAGGYIPPRALIKVDLGTNMVELVNPPFTDKEGNPITGTVRVNNDSRIEMRMGPAAFQNNSGQFTYMAYHATWVKRTGRGAMQALPSGYPNRFTATGACRQEG